MYVCLIEAQGGLWYVLYTQLRIYGHTNVQLLAHLCTHTVKLAYYVPQRAHKNQYLSEVFTIRVGLRTYMRCTQGQNEEYLLSGLVYVRT